MTFSRLKPRPETTAIYHRRSQHGSHQVLSVAKLLLMEMMAFITDVNMATAKLLE
jgi:hypothetical protein